MRTAIGSPEFVVKFENPLIIDDSGQQLTGIHDVDSLRAGFSRECNIFFSGREHFFSAGGVL